MCFRNTLGPNWSKIRKFALLVLMDTVPKTVALPLSYIAKAAIVGFEPTQKFVSNTGGRISNQYSLVKDILAETASFVKPISLTGWESDDLSHRVNNSDPQHTCCFCRFFVSSYCHSDFCFRGLELNDDKLDKEVQRSQKHCHRNLRFCDGHPRGSVALAKSSFYIAHTDALASRSGTICPSYS